MASWVVLEAPPGAAPGEELVLTRDGFSFLAFLFPPLWLLWHRLWIEAIAAFAVLMVAAALESTLGLAVSAPLSLLVSIFVGLDGNAMRIARRRRRGWSSIGVVDAGSADEAETRLAEADEIGEERPQDRAAIVPAASVASAAPPSPGLLLNPGR
jgi:hypothetical protein